MKRIFTALLLCVPTLAPAQSMTTAAEVKPIVSAIRANWVSVRVWEGQDLLYFTNLLAWRCGFDRIEFSVNGGELAMLDGEPCYEDEAAPNALKLVDQLPYIAFQPNSIETVLVTVHFDDGTTETAEFERATIASQ